MEQKTRDNLIYLGVGLTIVAAFTTYMFYGESTTGEIRDIPGPILWGILSDAGIAALILERYWRYRRRWSLWLLLLAAASINSSVVFVAYYLGWHVPVLVWSTLTGLCVVVLFVVADRVVGGKHKGQCK